MLLENKSCTIKYVHGKDIFLVKKRGECFALNPLEEEQNYF